MKNFINKTAQLRYQLVVTLPTSHVTAREAVGTAAVATATAATEAATTCVICQLGESVCVIKRTSATATESTTATTATATTEGSLELRQNDTRV